MQKTESKAACTHRQETITHKDLPLSCPHEGQTLWNAHPKVYLPMDKGEAICPYCGTHFFLK